METFASIRERAARRKGGEGVLATLLPTVPDRASLAELRDDRVLSTMANRIFCAGFVWSVIEAKWPGFEEAFLGFEPRALLFQPDDFWGDLASDKRIVRHGTKIRAVRENAAFVAAIAAEHGSFGLFLSGWPADDQAGLLQLLSKRGSRLGGATGQYLLRWLGWDGWIVSADFTTALREGGLEIAANPTSARDLRAIQNQLNAWRAETGLPYIHLSRILAMSTGVNRTPEELRRYMGGE